MHFGIQFDKSHAIVVSNQPIMARKSIHFTFSDIFYDFYCFVLESSRILSISLHSSETTTIKQTSRPKICFIEFRADYAP